MTWSDWMKEFIKALAIVGLGLIALGLAGSLFQAKADERSWCGPGANVPAHFAEVGEIPSISWQETWQNNDGTAYTLSKALFFNPDTGTWTMVFGGENGNVCTMRHGVGFVEYGERTDKKV